MLWDVTTKFNQPQLAALAGHAQLVIDVSWAEDSATLISGSYDHSVKLWDVEKSELVTSKVVDGLVQCVSYNMAENNQFFFGTSKCFLHMADARSEVCRTWTNDAMVNALHVAHDGLTVTTGDSKGMLKTWDVRMDACLEELTVLNDPAGHAISHVHASPANDGGDDGRFLGVNSYDNILRVYDRRSKLISSRTTRRGPNGGSNRYDSDQLELVCSVSGHKNRNWPIKSSFFRGDGYKYKLALPPRGWLQGGFGASSGSVSRRELTDAVREDFADTSGEHGSMDASREMLLLATGSADRHIYLHEMLPPNNANNED
ncbi:WD40 repeat-containing protein [Plasmopara halstedii]|uniref:WD40 repeat-containing protein n=1 Tax=Plasmopara halstedii TaxID=4781 RepID=A0A0P1AZR8_PLAHL|nr:WD40 repeat-containing protein [Plasmopara halstedii]CEG46463.1 WD40 repeat-containing protein [Plasmopara halstedii]|eukprot:XP_024582832.1 WD40 repeat-containing protein [Plasmopara halstedii]